MTNTTGTGISRRGFIQASVGAAAAVHAGCAHLRTSKMSRQPNVIYLFSDEHRWQSLSWTELPQVRTPNMARLAAESTEFTNCISNYPVCSPYRGILLSGRWPHETGVIDNGLPLSPDERTIGKAFRDTGYATGYIGKWHLVGERAEPFGFDHSLIWDRTNAHWDTSRYFPASGDPVQPQGYNATLMTDQALEFIDAHAHEPFFLMVSWNPPHSNFMDPPREKFDLYPENSLPRRPNTSEGGDDGEGNALKRNGDEPYRGYHAHISAIDDELGRVLRKLDELGLSENTILVYTSDHGSMFGSHGVGGKRQPYEESIRVPFLIRHPRRIPAGVRMDSLLGTVDIVPTLCGLAGVDVPARCVGEDFTGRLLGKSGPDPESQFIMHISKEHASGGRNHPAPLFRGVRTRQYTYAALVDGGGLLFDNLADPYQVNNLYESASHRRLRDELVDSTNHWLEVAKDPYRVSA